MDGQQLDLSFLDDTFDGTDYGRGQDVGVQQGASTNPSFLNTPTTAQAFGKTAQSGQVQSPHGFPQSLQSSNLPQSGYSQPRWSPSSAQNSHHGAMAHRSNPQNGYTARPGSQHNSHMNSPPTEQNTHWPMNSFGDNFRQYLSPQTGIPHQSSTQQPGRNRARRLTGQSQPQHNPQMSFSTNFATNPNKYPNKDAVFQTSKEEISIPSSFGPQNVVTPTPQLPQITPPSPSETRYGGAPGSTRHRAKRRKVESPDHQCRFKQGRVLGGGSANSMLESILDENLTQVKAIAKILRQCPKDLWRSLRYLSNQKFENVRCAVGPDGDETVDERSSAPSRSDMQAPNSNESESEADSDEEDSDEDENQDNDSLVFGKTTYSRREIEAMKEHARSKTRRPCPSQSPPENIVENSVGNIPCPVPGCNKLFTKNGWRRHVLGYSVERLWKCQRCSEDSTKNIFGRAENLRKHLNKVHYHGAGTCRKGATDEEKSNAAAVKQLISAEAKRRKPYTVPFHAQCGICANFRSDNWKDFWMNHVFDHLENEGVQCKDRWDYGTAPVPPKWRDESKPKPKTQPRNRRNTNRCDGDNEDQDDSSDPDDDDGPGQGPGKGNSRKFPRQSKQDDRYKSSKQPNQGSGRHSNNGSGKQRKYYGSAVSSSSERSLREICTIVLDEERRACRGSIEYMSVSDYLTELTAADITPCSKLSSLRQGVDIQQFLPFRSIKVLSRGLTTLVEEIEYSSPFNRCARKRVRPISSKEQLQERYDKEVTALRRLAHPHTLQLVDFFRELTTYSLILKPAAEMTLGKYLSIPPQIQKHNVKGWFGCLASAVHHLHSSEVNVCHLNINLSNILLHGGRIVLADFSLSEFSRTRNFVNRSTSTQTADDKAIDVFGLGRVYLEMLTVLGGFSVRSHEKLRNLIQKGSGRTHEHQSAHSALLWLRILDVRFRKLTLDTKETVFFKNALGVCKLMLQPRASLRPSAGDICDIFPSSACCGTRYRSTPTGLETLMQRLALEKPKYRALVAGIRESPSKPAESAEKPKSKEQFLSIGDWAQDIGRGDLIMKSEDDEGEDSDSSTLVDATSHQPPSGTRHHAVQKSWTWPLSRTEARSPQFADKPFMMFAGEIHLKREDEDFKSYESRWSAWTSFCHNLKWIHGDPSFWQKLSSRYLDKHATLCGHVPRDNIGGDTEVMEIVLGE